MPVHKVALFGLGRAGTIHFLNALANHQLEIAYVVEADADRATTLLAEYYQTGRISVLSPEEADTVYKDATLEAVIVATPTFTHSAIVRKALQHGKAVFCEKPIAEDLTEAKTCYEEAEKAGKALLCAFNRRFDPSLRIVQKRAMNQEIGKLHMVKSTARDSPTPSLEYLKKSGGFIHDSAVHDLDLVSWVLGEYPVKVYVQASSHMAPIAQIGDVDCVAIVMNFASGPIAVIDLDRNSQYGYDQRLEVFGDKGMLHSENQTQTGVVCLDAEGTHRDVLHYSFPQRYADSYRAALQHFIDVIEDKMPCEITKENTLRMYSVVDACRKSQQTGLPVEIDYAV